MVDKTSWSPVDLKEHEASEIAEIITSKLIVKVNKNNDASLDF